MRVSIVATGIDVNADAQPRTPMISLVHDADQSKAKTVEEAPAEENATKAIEAEPAPVAETPAPAQAEMPVAAKPEAPAEKPAEKPVPASAFIPPKPVAAERKPAPAPEQRRADAFAEAAMTNAGAQSERRRGRSLFQKVTGAVNRAIAEEQPAPAAPAPVQRREPVAAAAAMPAAMPAAEAAPAVAEVPVMPEPAPAALPEPVIEAVAEPVVEAVTETIAEPVAEAVVEPAPQPELPAAPAPAQQTLADIEPAQPSTPSRDEEDMLEIPAFLRRQAN